MENPTISFDDSLPDGRTYCVFLEFQGSFIDFFFSLFDRGTLIEDYHQRIFDPVTSFLFNFGFEDSVKKELKRKIEKKYGTPHP